MKRIRMRYGLGIAIYAMAFLEAAWRFDLEVAVVLLAFCICFARYAARLGWEKKRTQAMQ